MLNLMKYTGVIIGTLTLIGCSAFNPPFHPFHTYNDHGTELYPEGYENTVATIDNSPQEVDVPASYHMSAYHHPASPKDVDLQWVHAQSSTGYTIEIAESDKPSVVANSLQLAPKIQRRAEVEYQIGSRTLYKGVYGSYSTMDEAQQALQSLPTALQSNARITSWGSVQSTIGS